MKKVMIAFGLLFIASCNSPEILCFYTYSNSPSSGGFPYYEVMGRTERYRSDVEGPYFSTVEDAVKYIKDNDLKMCGSNK